MFTPRKRGWAICAEVSGYHPYTRYHVLEDGKLAVTVPGGVLPEQRDLIKAHKEDLIIYLTTSPDAAIIGICRNRHRVRWVCTEYGVWLCKCYYDQPHREEHKSDTEEPDTRETLKDYWQEEKKGEES